MDEQLTNFLSEWNNDSDSVIVHTSGSTGVPKQMMVLKSRMLASARKTCDFLRLVPGDSALLCMSLDYIAGKMMVVRSIERSLSLIAVNPSSHPLAGLVYAPVFVAMVPMQVAKSLESPHEADLLRKVRHLIIGGGAVDDNLAAQLRDLPNFVWSTYGMTETLSHIAMRRVNGPDATDWYSPLDGVSLRLTSDGTLAICAPDVCDGEVVTNDLCELAPDGKRFRVLGRRDNTINTGGVKVQIELAEDAVARALVKDSLRHSFRFSSRPHPVLGQEVVLIVERGLSNDDVQDIVDACGALPNKYWKPRAVLHAESLPMTGNGKPDRKKTYELALLLSQDCKMFRS